MLLCFSCQSKFLPLFLQVNILASIVWLINREQPSADSSLVFSLTRERPCAPNFTQEMLLGVTLEVKQPISELILQEKLLSLFQQPTALHQGGETLQNFPHLSCLGDHIVRSHGCRPLSCLEDTVQQQASWSSGSYKLSIPSSMIFQALNIRIKLQMYQQGLDIPQSVVLCVWNACSFL